jgi:hypothetical protein
MLAKDLYNMASDSVLVLFSLLTVQEVSNFREAFWPALCHVPATEEERAKVLELRVLTSVLDRLAYRGLNAPMLFMVPPQAIEWEFLKQCESRPPHIDDDNVRIGIEWLVEIRRKERWVRQAKDLKHLRKEEAKAKRCGTKQKWNGELLVPTKVHRVVNSDFSDLFR